MGNAVGRLSAPIASANSELSADDIRAGPILSFGHARRFIHVRSRGAGRQSGARQRADGIARRPCADGERARLCGRGLAADDQRPPRQADAGAAAGADQARPALLLSAGVPAGRPDARGHHVGRRRRTVALSAALAGRRGAADGAHLLRSSGGPARRRLDGRAHGPRSPGADRGRRHGDARRRGIPARISAWTCIASAAAIARSAVHAWIGASGGRISRARSARRLRRAASSSAGSPGCATRAR